MIFEVVIKQETRQKTIETLKSLQDISEEKERETNLFFEKLERFVKESMEENMLSFQLKQHKEQQLDVISIHQFHHMDVYGIMLRLLM